MLWKKEKVLSDAVFTTWRLRIIIIFIIIMYGYHSMRYQARAEWLQGIGSGGTGFFTLT
jgi:hypothetical protein